MFKRQKFVCTSCGYVGRPVKITKGSILIELLLWICFIIPGILYSFWRLASRYKACPECEKPDMIPVDTPRGRKLVRDMEEEEA